MSEKLEDEARKFQAKREKAAAKKRRQRERRRQGSVASATLLQIRIDDVEAWREVIFQDTDQRVTRELSRSSPIQQLTELYIWHKCKEYIYRQGGKQAHEVGKLRTGFVAASRPDRDNRLIKHGK
jgi:hypothetical protein